MRLFSSCLRAQILKELLCVLRDPRARAIILGPPLMQLLIFSFAATLEVRNAQIAVFDRDGGQWSQELVSRIEAAQFTGKVLMVHNIDDLTNAINRRQALLAVTIPETFSKNLIAGTPAALQVIVDGRRANSGQVALNYVEAIAMGLKATLHSTVTSDIKVRHWFNPNLTYTWFIVPSLAGILAMFTSLIITSLSIARERELGTFDQLLVSPTRPMEIIVAKVVPAVIIGTMLGMAMVAAGALIFDIPLQGSVILLCLAMMLFILSIVGVGLMISSICATQQQAILGTFALGIPMILMSGFATPVENMPHFLQSLAECIPLRHFLVIAQGTFLKALPIQDIGAHVWPMALIALVTLSAATLLVRSKLQ